MSYVDRLIDLGAPLGERDHPGMLKWLAERGIAGNSLTIGHIRIKHTSAKDLLERVLCANLLTKNDPFLKDKVYSGVASGGLELNQAYQEESGKVGKLAAVGYTGELGEKLSLKPHQLRRVLRAMRADLVSSQILNPDPEASSSFRRTVEHYFSDFQDRSNPYPSPGIARLANSWKSDGAIIDFYSNFYGLGLKEPTRGTWLPYEMEFMSQFYSKRLENQSSGLTLFDSLVLENRRSNGPTPPLITHLRDVTHIPIDFDVIWVHRNALMLGQVKSPLAA